MSSLINEMGLLNKNLNAIPLAVQLILPKLMVTDDRLSVFGGY